MSSLLMFNRVYRLDIYIILDTIFCIAFYLPNLSMHQSIPISNSTYIACYGNGVLSACFVINLLKLNSLL
jgi:hypothetical protein